MYLPPKGYLTGNASNLKDPHRLGAVLWSLSPEGCQVPLDLHHKLTINDEQGLHKVFEKLMRTRKARPALHVVYEHDWDDIEAVKPYLILSIHNRAEARDMIATGEWDEFWHTAN